MRHDRASGNVLNDETTRLPLVTMSAKKPNLPEKTCVVCGRPFKWRKKWAKCWEQVKYCSDKCRRQKAVSGSTR